MKLCEDCRIRDSCWLKDCIDTINEDYLEEPREITQCPMKEYANRTD